jgi:hypothetical protein
MSDPQEKNVINIDPGTALFVVTALLLVPLLLMGFLFQ